MQARLHWDYMITFETQSRRNARLIAGLRLGVDNTSKGSALTFALTRNNNAVAPANAAVTLAHQVHVQPSTRGVDQDQLRSKNGVSPSSALRRVST